MAEVAEVEEATAEVPMVGPAVAGGRGQQQGQHSPWIIITVCAGRQQGGGSGGWSGLRGEGQASELAERCSQVSELAEWRSQASELAASGSAAGRKTVKSGCRCPIGGFGDDGADGITVHVECMSGLSHVCVAYDCKCSRAPKGCRLQRMSQEAGSILSPHWLALQWDGQWGGQLVLVDSQCVVAPHWPRPPPVHEGSQQWGTGAQHSVEVEVEQLEVAGGSWEAMLLAALLQLRS